VRDSVRDAIDGIVVERGADPAASLARATALLARDVSRRRALAAEAAAGAARFDVAARLAEVEALYRELVVAG
jgi:hypothetical protein